MKIYLILFCLAFEFAFSKDIIVIGAGVSGIRTASLLKEKGHTVKILEARDRYGGRIHSFKTPNDYILDLGAAWIHGINNNPLMKLAKDNGVPTVHFDNTKKVHSKLNPEFTNSELKQAGNKFKEYLKKLESDGVEDDSLENTLIKYINEKNLDATNIALLKNWAFMEIEIEFASKLNYLSRISYNNPEQNGGGDDLMPSGYINIFKNFYENLKDDIQYNKIIKKIVEDGNKVKIYDKDNNEYISDLVVVTVPLGCLKKNTIEFVPDLSEEKKNSIKKMNFGTMNKVIIEFTEKFWDENENVIKILADPRLQYPWMVNYYNVINKNVLIFLTTDEDFEKKTDDQIKNEVIESLSKVYDKDKINIKYFKRTEWRTDPYSYGSYTSYGVGTTEKEVNILAKKHENLIYFAGEHTFAKFLSTVNSAYKSAEEVVNKITNDLTKLKFKKNKVI